MLSWDNQLQIEGTTLLRDDEDARKFYYLPNQVVLATDEKGLPDLMLLRYRRDAGEVAAGASAGGGLLQLRYRLGISDGDLAKLSSAAGAQLAQEKKDGTQPFGLTIDSVDPLLGPPTWTSTAGTLRVGDDPNPQTATPGPDLAVAASLTLSLDGANLVWNALAQHQPSPVAIVASYQLGFDARSAGDAGPKSAVAAHTHTVEKPVELALAGPDQIAALLRDVDLSDDFFAVETVTVSSSGIAFGSDGVTMIHVFLRYAETDEAERARPQVVHDYDGLLSNAQDKVVWSFRRAGAVPAGHKNDYQWRIDVMSGDGTSNGDWTLSRNPALVLTSTDLGIRRVDFTWHGDASTNAAQVALRSSTVADAPADEQLLLSATRPTASWTQRFPPGSAPPDFSYRVTWQLASNAQLTQAAQTSSASSIDLASPFAKKLNFQFKSDGPLDGKSILLEFHYQDAPNGYQVRRSIKLDASNASASLDVPVIAGGPEDADWSAVVLGGGMTTPLPHARCRAGTTIIPLKGGGAT